MITVSGRKSRGVSILEYLSSKCPYGLGEIDSVFGFAEHSVLYGGRPYHGEELSSEDINDLYEHDVGLRLPLTNHFVTRKEFDDSKEFLTKYHRKNNSVVVVNDDLCEWIKEDYPLYEVEASAIKKIDNIKKLNGVSKLYDSVVLPADCNDDKEFLESILDKDKIRLFIRAGCAYTCKSRICYKSFSESMKKEGVELLCSMESKPRKHLGMVNFSMTDFRALGFNRFKAVV